MYEADLRQQRHAVVTGGGTAGHVAPGLAVADELRRRGWSVSWLGRAASMEERLVTDAGLAMDFVPARPVLGKSWPQRLGALVTTLRGVLQARRHLARRSAAAVLGTGGYVCAPGVLAAWSRHCPTVLFEPNAVMGLANRQLARLVDRIAFGYANSNTDSEQNPARVVSGVPVHESFSDPQPLPGFDRRRLLVLGGSQGSLELNQVLPRAIGLLPSDVANSLDVVHQCGATHVEATRELYVQHCPSVFVAVEGFLFDVAERMGGAHLVVSRAGAQTLAELAAAARPAILVPLSIAQAHQAANARRLESSEAARCLIAPTPEEMASALGEVLDSPEQLVEMGAAMGSHATPNAASTLADLIEGLVPS